MRKLFVTTPIYYVNDIPHIGHAYTTLAADIIARYWKEKIGNRNVFFLTGTDEHGQKVALAAKEKGVNPKKYTDLMSVSFREAWKLLCIDHDYFIRTTDKRHHKVVTDILQKIYDKGYIYKGAYKGLYCVGCEKFLTEVDLQDGKCPLHPDKEPLYQEEENYFLKLGVLSKKVLKKIENNELRILPSDKRKEIVKRIQAGVQDISISRSGVSWGIAVPWDKSQTVYVWADALINYYTATQISKDKKRFWPADLHLIGKDILWFHSVIWPALLIAAGVELPKTIFAHGFFTINGQKMSKSLGNTISPKELVDRYGVDGTRYLIISTFPFGSDGDISFSKFDKKFNADLSNGLGNLISRVTGLIEKSSFASSQKKEIKPDPKICLKVENYALDEALRDIGKKIKRLDIFINKNKAWSLKGKDMEKALEFLIKEVLIIAADLSIFMPNTSAQIKKHFTSPQIRMGSPLFPRIIT